MTNGTSLQLGRRGLGRLTQALAITAAAGAALGSVPGVIPAALAQTSKETIKIGILHSLSGTMAISETTLKDVMLMLIDAAERRRAACSATSWRRWSLTRRPTGRCLPRRRAS